MIDFFRQWLKKFFERESYYVVFLIAIATAALFREKCSFVEWAVASGGFAGIGLSALQLKRKLLNGSYTKISTVGPSKLIQAEGFEEDK